MKRRNFIKLAGLAAVSATSAPIARAETPAPENATKKTLRTGLIGTGWYGNVDLYHLMQVGAEEDTPYAINVVALCDVDRQALDNSAARVAERQEGREPMKFNDYREMLKEANLDLVLIATPDHWHALNMIDAVKAGCDVYVQKPISVDIKESLAMLETARENGAVVQVGMQRRSTTHLRRAKELFIDSGKLGRVGQVKIYSYYGGPGAPAKLEPTPVPDGFDFDMWCGPAPKLPFYPALRRGWRGFMEYGNGTLGDMGVHMFDMARWLLDLGYPKRIFSAGGQYIKRGGTFNRSDTQTVIFDYGDMEVIWDHRDWSEIPDRRHPWGGYFYGEHGLLKASVFGYDFNKYYSDEVESANYVDETELYPQDKKEPGLELQCAEAIRNHMRDLLARIADRGRPRSDIEEGAISTICCILGNLSMQLGRALEWDPEAGMIRGDDEANALLAREYRSPWIHP
ncbi:MAG: Gfo/Idh/MocA family protein [Thermoguttaceae bacterium]|jgi:predicted dehydrogenase